MTVLPSDRYFIPEFFAKGFNATMTARNLSCREAAKEIGISHATVNRVSRGGTPDVETFLRISAWTIVNERFVTLRDEKPCETCIGDIHVCATVPMLHCEKANREDAK